MIGARQFGRALGVANDDLRVVLTPAGKVNLLAVSFSYRHTTATAFDSASFQGRIVVVGGSVDINQVVDVTTNLDPIGPVAFDIDVHDLGPHTFFFPLSQLKGNVQVDEGNVMTIIVARPITALGEVFIPKLYTAGQLVFGNDLAGQRGVPA
jgi:hypothetical protein